MNFAFVTKVVVVVLLLFANSCKNHLPPKEQAAPNHIRAMFKSDPATSVVIGWNRYKGAKSQDILFWDTVDHGVQINHYAHSVLPDKRTNYFGLRSAFVELKNLTPNTRVYFVIQNEFGISKRYYVDTLPSDKNAKLSLIAGGDSRNHREVRRNANLLVSKLKPHAVLFGGDMTDKGTPGQWFKWFSDWEFTHGKDGRVTPLVAARGNHEISNLVLYTLFWLPLNNYYSLNFSDGLLQTYVLNSESSVAGNQASWLEKNLEKNKSSIWQIAMYHKPMRPHVKAKKEGTNIYHHWVHLFYNYGVDLVVESDSHAVKSTWPIKPSSEAGSEEGFIRDDANGITFVGEGCWGAPTRAADDAKSWTRDSDQFNQFKLIHITKNKMEIRTVNVDNAPEVGELDLVGDRFILPDNLMLWTPENGDVIVIEK